MPPRPEAIEIHLKNAKFAEIETQAAELRQTYEIYKTLRKVTRKPGDLSMDYEIRSKGGAAARGKQLTAERLRQDAAKFRILQGIKEHVGARVPDVAAFDLAFDLSCRQVPDIVLPDEVIIGQTTVAG